MYSKAYKRYVTALLLVVFMFNQADRAVFAFLMEPIKRTFNMSDSQIGFLAGPALVFFYATLGIPIARRADRRNRINMISAATAAWSVMAALSGCVNSFWQLVITRIGVGVGEAGFTAIAQSVIGDYHSVKERTRALAVFMLGIPLAVPFSSFVAGVASERLGWRATFFIVGLPGIALAALVKVTMREPERYKANLASGEEGRSISLKEVIATLWKRRALRHLAIAMMLVNTVVASVLTWIPTFFIRLHGMGTGELGTWLAIPTCLGGSLGVWLGGYLTARFGAKDERVYTSILASTALILPPTLLVLLLWPNKVGALSVVFPTYVLMFLFYAPCSSLIQSLTERGMRATMLAITLMMQVIFGGMGAWLLGILSDLLTPIAGSGALRWALITISILSLLSAVYFWMGGRTIREDLRVADLEEGHQGIPGVSTIEMNPVRVDEPASAREH